MEDENQGWNAQDSHPSKEQFWGACYLIPPRFASRIEAHLSTAITDSHLHWLFSIPSRSPIPLLLLPGIISQETPCTQSLSQALLLGEHKFRHWSNWSTSLPLRGRCCRLFMYVCIPSFQMKSSRLRVVKEHSQIPKTVSDIAVVGRYQLTGQFSIMDCGISWLEGLSIIECGILNLLLPSQESFQASFFPHITAPMKF